MAVLCCGGKAFVGVGVASIGGLGMCAGMSMVMSMQPIAGHRN